MEWAAVIANQLGHLTGGFIRLFKGDFSGAWENFRELGTANLEVNANSSCSGKLSLEVPLQTPEEADADEVSENAKEVGRTIVDGALCGVEEATGRTS